MHLEARYVTGDLTLLFQILISAGLHGTADLCTQDAIDRCLDLVAVYNIKHMIVPQFNESSLNIFCRYTFFLKCIIIVK